MDYFSVLVVDDEEDFLETLVNRLKKRKVSAIGVKSGEEAIEVIKERQVDVILLDIKMPGGMDGIETLREIKNLQPICEVIILTGHGSIETTKEGMKLGAFDYLMKPVKIEELLPKLAEAFEKKNDKDHKIRNAQIQKLFRYT